jgi:hypothetical protein
MYKEPFPSNGYFTVSYLHSCYLALGLNGRLTLELEGTSPGMFHILFLQFYEVAEKNQEKPSEIRSKYILQKCLESKRWTNLFGNAR